MRFTQRRVISSMPNANGKRTKNFVKIAFRVKHSVHSIEIVYRMRIDWFVSSIKFSRQLRHPMCLLSYVLWNSENYSMNESGDERKIHIIIRTNIIRFCGLESNKNTWSSSSSSNVGGGWRREFHSDRIRTKKNCRRTAEHKQHETQFTEKQRIKMIQNTMAKGRKAAVRTMSK